MCMKQIRSVDTQFRRLANVIQFEAAPHKVKYDVESRKHVYSQDGLDMNAFLTRVKHAGYGHD